MIETKLSQSKQTKAIKKQQKAIKETLTPKSNGNALRAPWYPREARSWWSNVYVSSRGIHYIELSKMEFMMCMLEIKDNNDTWKKLLKMAVCHLWENNNRSLLLRDDFPLSFLLFRENFHALPRKIAQFWEGSGYSLVHALSSFWAQYVLHNLWFEWLWATSRALCNFLAKGRFSVGSVQF